MFRKQYMIAVFMVLGSWAFAQNGAPTGSSAPGPTQPVPSGAAPVPGATDPTSTPFLPSTSPQPYPMVPNDRYPASVSPPGYDPNVISPNALPNPGTTVYDSQQSQPIYPWDQPVAPQVPAQPTQPQQQ